MGENGQLWGGGGAGCERKRTKGHLERGWVVVGGREAEMHEWQRGAGRVCGGGGGGCWRGKQRSVGVWGAGMWWVMPRSDLISVFWLTGWEQREVRPLLTATHSALCQIWTVNQQADRLGYPIRHFFFFPPPTPSLDFPSIHGPPSFLHLSWSASHVKSLTEFNYTCCPRSSQTSAPPPAGS